MFRKKAVRALGILAIGSAMVVTTGPTASAGLFGRHSGCASSYYDWTSQGGGGGSGGGGGGGGVADPESVRQVRAIYFSTEFNAWFEVDAVVPPGAASIGLSAIVTVPDVGAVRGWVVSVYNQPRMTSPYKTETNNANSQQGAGGRTSLNAPRQNTPDVPVAFSAPNTVLGTSISTPQRSLSSGVVRMWTNKSGTRHVQAELLEIRNNAILVRDASGKIFEQSFDGLSDADVAFLRTGSLPVSKLASAIR